MITIIKKNQPRCKWYDVLHVLHTIFLCNLSQGSLFHVSLFIIIIIHVTQFLFYLPFSLTKTILSFSRNTTHWLTSPCGGLIITDINICFVKRKKRNRLLFFKGKKNKKEKNEEESESGKGRKKNTKIKTNGVFFIQELARMMLFYFRF